MRNAAPWIVGAAVLALLAARRAAPFNPSIEVRFPAAYGDDAEGPTVIEPSDAAQDNAPSWGADYMQGEFLGPSRQVAAFLYMLRRAEHRARDVDLGVDYRTFYGGAQFFDMSDHPVITGELAPVKLDAAKCRAAGYASGLCYSTAAGAYQIIRPTWVAVREHAPRLVDFSPEMQDLAAVRILDRIGALAAIERGDIDGALALASKQWASLPGSLAKQSPKTRDQVLAYFAEGGGSLA